MSKNHFQNYFDYGSLLPSLLFIFGMYSVFLFIQKNYSIGFFVILFCFIIYIANNLIINYKGFSTIFNEYLEDTAAFVAFSLSTIVFGLQFFDNNPVLLGVLLFYALAQFLFLARNWVLKVKNSCGWPLPLNGIFFPFFYYIYLFYMQGFGEATFFIYYVVVGFLSLSHKNFLGYEEEKKQNYEVVDKREYEKIKKLVLKELEETKEKTSTNE
jgi:hypothetical protein